MGRALAQELGHTRRSWDVIDLPLGGRALKRMIGRVLNHDVLPGRRAEPETLA